MTFALYVLLVVVAYLLGAIPFGLLAGRLKGRDIRRYGSGNTGATNVLRSIGWQAAAAVFILDIAKAVVPVFLARWLVDEPVLEAACGLAAVVGHNWPVYIGWKGGKGVSSSLAVLVVLVPATTLVGAAIAVSLIAWSRYVSLGSLAGAILIPLFALLYTTLATPLPPAYVVLSLVLGAMIVVQHRENIGRLLAGTERKLGRKAEV